MVKREKKPTNKYYYEIRLWRQFFLPVIALVMVSILGVAGYVFIEHFGVLEAIYYVVVTLTTVGFRSSKELSSNGMVFDMLFVAIGIFMLVVVIGRAIEFIASGEYIRIRRMKKMEKKISGLKNHYIICGYGRVGHQVASEFEAARLPFMVIDNKPETASELESTNIPFIIGDGSSDSILENAGVKKAKGLIATNDSDTANVYVTLSARVANPSIIIIARAGSIDVEEKLKKAGANKVISPYFIAGKRMAAMVTKPVGMDFLDTVLHSENLEMEMREFAVDANSHLSNKTLGGAQIRQKSGAYIVAIRMTDGTFNFQPVAESKIEPNEVLVAIGTPNQLDKLQEIIK